MAQHPRRVPLALTDAMLLLLSGGAALTLFWFLLGRGLVAATGLRAPAEWDLFEGHALAGAFVYAAAAQAVHFAVPLHAETVAAASAGLFLVLLRLRWRDAQWAMRGVVGAVRARPLDAALFCLFAVVVALAAARPCKVEDTGLYHAPVLRWAAEVKLAPGLALLHGRLGFNSLWFPLEAALSFTFLSNGPLPLVNTTVFLLGALFLVRRMTGTACSPFASRLATAALVPYVALGFLYAGSQSPDLPALTFGLLASFLSAAAIESRDDRTRILGVVLSAATVSWKLSALPLLLWIPLLVWDRTRESDGDGAQRLAPSRTTRPWLVASVVVTAAGVLTVARSVVLSGYPFFPSTSMDLFTVDWKAPAWLANGQAMWVYAWARGLHRGNPQDTLAYPLSQWLPMWVANWSSLNRFFMPLLGAALVALPFSCVLPAVRGWTRVLDRRALTALALVAACGTAFWFWQAPDVRFGSSYLTTLFAVACVPWLAVADRSVLVRRALPWLVMTAAIGLVAQNLLTTTPLPPWSPAAYAQAHPGRFYWLAPAPYPEAAFIEETLGDGSTNLVVANGGLAHFGPVPNSPLPVAGHAVRRGPRLGDGYRLDSGPAAPK